MLRFHACPAGNYMFKVNNRNTSTRCEICSNLTIKTPDDAIVNFEQVNAGWVGSTIKLFSPLCGPSFPIDVKNFGAKLFCYIWAGDDSVK